MDRIIVAFESTNSHRRVTEMLESGGISVRCSCRSGAEVIRTINRMGGGIVICASKLSDMSASDLAQDLKGSAMLLVVAASNQLTFCNSDDVFKLPTPVSRTDLIASVRMLIQMEQKYLRLTLPRRSIEDTRLVESAKKLLMAKNHISEEQAHNFIQKKSMENRSKMAEAAQLILGTY